MREAAIIRDGQLVNVIVLPEGGDGDALLSATCVEITDLDPKPGLGSGWTFVDDAFVPPVIPPPTRTEIEQARRDRYEAETDPMYMKIQRNEDGLTLDDWKAAVAQIKTDLPYPAPLT